MAGSYAKKGFVPAIVSDLGTAARKGKWDTQAVPSPWPRERLTADFLSLVSVERLTLFHLEVDFLLVSLEAALLHFLSLLPSGLLLFDELWLVVEAVRIGIEISVSQEPLLWLVLDQCCLSLSSGPALPICWEAVTHSPLVPFLAVCHRWERDDRKEPPLLTKTRTLDSVAVQCGLVSVWQLIPSPSLSSARPLC